MKTRTKMVEQAKAWLNKILFAYPRFTNHNLSHRVLTKCDILCLSPSARVREKRQKNHLTGEQTEKPEREPTRASEQAAVRTINHARTTQTLEVHAAYTLTVPTQSATQQLEQLRIKGGWSRQHLRPSPLPTPPPPQGKTPFFPSKMWLALLFVVFVISCLFLLENHTRFEFA